MYGRRPHRSVEWSKRVTWPVRPTDVWFIRRVKDRKSVVFRWVSRRSGIGGRVQIVWWIADSGPRVERCGILGLSRVALYRDAFLSPGCWMLEPMRTLSQPVLSSSPWLIPPPFQSPCSLFPLEAPSASLLSPAPAPQVSHSSHVSTNLS